MSRPPVLCGGPFSAPSHLTCVRHLVLCLSSWAQQASVWPCSCIRAAGTLGHIGCRAAPCLGATPPPPQASSLALGSSCAQTAVGSGSGVTCARVSASSPPHQGSGPLPGPGARRNAPVPPRPVVCTAARSGLISVRCCHGGLPGRGLWGGTGTP